LNLSENIKRINQKLQQLLKQYQHLQKLNEDLTLGLQRAKLQEKQQQQHLLQLEQQVGILQSAAGKMNDEDKKAFEKHLNQYIKEIDKCIGLLSE